VIRVLIVDDHAAVRAGLAELLATTDDLRCIGEAADGAEAVVKTAELHPDVVLMDLSMPGGDGVTATARLRADHPEIHVLVLTSFSDQQRVVAALDAGAEGYLMKHSEPEVILSGIRDITTGRSPLDSRVARVLIETRTLATPGPLLTDRENDVLRLVAAGELNRTIGRQLDISERTVKAHLTSIYTKLGVTGRHQATLWARQHQM
jgi:DNA-binding NarL/FixJ family response regulator